MHSSLVFITLRTCTRGKVIGLSSLLLSAQKQPDLSCGHQSQLQWQLNYQKQQKTGLARLGIKQHWPWELQIKGFVFVMPINHTHSWPCAMHYMHVQVLLTRCMAQVLHQHTSSQVLHQHTSSQNAWGTVLVQMQSSRGLKFDSRTMSAIRYNTANWYWTWNKALCGSHCTSYYSDCCNMCALNATEVVYQIHGCTAVIFLSCSKPLL